MSLVNFAGTPWKFTSLLRLVTRGSLWCHWLAECCPISSRKPPHRQWLPQTGSSPGNPIWWTAPLLLPGRACNDENTWGVTLPHDSCLSVGLRGASRGVSNFCPQSLSLSLSVCVSLSQSAYTWLPSSTFSLGNVSVCFMRWRRSHRLELLISFIVLMTSRLAKTEPTTSACVYLHEMETDR